MNGEAKRGWRDRARWFLAEFLVVVIGILVALALQAWWQQRSDREQERIYLRQLVGDLDETERILLRSDTGVAAQNTARLLRAYYMPARPPIDSIARWLSHIGFAEPRPILGTAEALISTGDISLLRDTSVRAQLTKYVEGTRTAVLVQHNFSEEWRRGYALLRSRVDLTEVAASVATQQRIDSIANANLGALLPRGARRHPFALDAETLLSDRVAFDGLSAIHTGDVSMLSLRRRMLKSARDLRTLVKADSLQP